ncbi:MAG: transglutaminase-like domain-containing protein [Prevotellaceae bacterium]|nr:transglutaminase-like domain-containing protein [Prevotellaceae bacterium]
METVLEQAGKNRRELEKVLKHYSREPADSLKWRAAEFLILNMPGKYSVYYDAPWNDVATVRLRWTSSSDKQKVLDTYKIGEPVIREDINCMTAEYLINNIELAFKVWRERPWGKQIPFDAFCEEILPYRVGVEPLENWREKALASFADLDSVLNKPATTSVEACGIINSLLPRFRTDKDFPPMNFSQLMTSARGMCDDMAALAVFSMRALGIPVTFDFTPHWINRPTGHSWNTVRDSTGNHISFMGAESNPYRPHPGSLHNTTYLKGKVYRKTFAMQQNIQTEDRNIPPLLEEHKNIKDVSAEYAQCTDTVTVCLKYPPVTPTGYVYLAIEQDRRFYPVAWTKDSGDTCIFPSMGRGIIYFPMYYANNRQMPAGDPFWLDNDGNRMILSPDNRDTLLNLNKIDPDNTLPFWIQRMYHGIFEGANQADFSDAKVLYTINHIPNVFYNDVTLRMPANYRYVRYKSPEDAYCNVSEIEFYGSEGEKLSGTSIGTPGAYKNTNSTCDKAFDGDVTTFYNAIESSGAWTGLDFQERKQIRKIHYLPKNEGQFIYEGHHYELFYWTKEGWTSLGKQTATSNGSLQYRAPLQALLYLENLTLRKKGRIFFITPDHEIHWR